MSESQTRSGPTTELSPERDDVVLPWRTRRVLRQEREVRKRDRATVRLDPALIAGVEALVDAGEFPNKSEAYRAATEQLLHDFMESTQ